MASVLVNGTTIEYDAFGSEANDPIVLISGLGVQMIRWSLPFCNILAARGFRVIRFDNRDVGLSTYFDNAPVPDLTTVAKAVASGENPEVPYTLDNMASDVIGLFDALGIEQAHLVGRSMGGMIAQLVASSHPDRVLSLAVIMSGTGNAALPPSAPDAMAALMRPAPHPLDDEAGFLNHAVATARVIASPAYPFDEDAQRAQALTEIKRAYNPAGFGRQLAALVATGDIRPRLHGITAATVVVHGSADKLVPPEAGRDIAANIKDAELMIMEGMGHDLPPELYNVVVTAIVENARR
ncbi:alpha/beta hydrolase [Phyllobacterium sp. YR531]|uniref:alpha/beta fold hydrolase n=1 Tax=Phyllobacterium sp. YR531 TaxID=1144343 RepID=UPI00026FB21B|nr:alpha/beta hydrolase [Phyllobacterium sp. YR531]EJN05467.1 putative hydrolase or acyltransferase of alpha/beta superfamily [Phyllobacterium sp. YR531]